jgi:hypothetical protein
MNEVEEVEEGGTEAEAEVESTSSESKVDLAEKDFPSLEDIVKANDLDEDWYEPLHCRRVHLGVRKDLGPTMCHGA